jgi:hypothetical protein
MGAPSTAGPSSSTDDRASPAVAAVGRRPGFAGSIRAHAGLVVFVVSYVIAFAAYGILLPRPNTVWYTAFVLGLGLVIAILNQRIGFTSGLLWALAAWALLHAAGGLIPLGHGVLYNADLHTPTLHYDRLIHAFGFGAAAVGCWQALRRHVPERPVAAGVAGREGFKRRRLREHGLGSDLQRDRVHGRSHLDLPGRPRRVETGESMNTVGIVLSVDSGRAEEFERAFRENEFPVWKDLHERGVLMRASLNRLDISSHRVDGSTQYLVVAVFIESEGHHEHDSHPGFKAWDEMAEQYQVAAPLAFGGDAVVEIGG